MFRQYIARRVIRAERGQVLVRADISDNRVEQIFTQAHKWMLRFGGTDEGFDEAKLTQRRRIIH